MSFSPSNRLSTFIWHFLKNHKTFLFSFLFLAVLTGLWAPINNVLIKYIIDTLHLASAHNALSILFWPAILFIINFESHNLFWRGMGMLNYTFQPLIKNKIINDVFGHVLQASHQFFQENLSGKIASHINTLADNIERIIHDLSRQLVRGIVLLIVSLISMYCVHPLFFIVLFLWFVIFITTSIYFSHRLITLAESHAKAESIISGKLVDSISNTMNVRMFSKRSEEVSYMKQFLLIAREQFQRKEKYAVNLYFFQGFSLSIMLGVMLFLLISLHADKIVSIGDFALILGLSVEVGFMTWWTMEQVDELNKSVGKCKQSLFSLFVPLTVKDKKEASILTVKKGEIVFSDVVFSYDGRRRPLFEKQSITIEAGQKVGLVGYSGGGKSTFVNLILRLYDIDQGHIFIDGQDIRDVTQDSLRLAIGMIPQDPSLFNRSLMENIRYGNTQARDEAVIEAAKKAHAHEFITHLAQGYDSLVGERGIKLSGGQRQRIAIARAILKDAPILVLDEATSQLDSITEQLIQDSLWKLMQDKTTIVIAHRLSTLLHMDRILVFNRGRIVQDGTHKELLQQKGLYHTLWNTQFS